MTIPAWIEQELIEQHAKIIAHCEELRVASLGLGLDLTELYRCRDDQLKAADQEADDKARIAAEAAAEMEAIIGSAEPP